MSESICVYLKGITRVIRQASLPKKDSELLTKEDFIESVVEIKLSFDGSEHFIEEAWLDDTIDFYAIADKYNFLDKLLEEALEQLKKDKKEALLDRAYVESFD